MYYYKLSACVLYDEGLLLDKVCGTREYSKNYYDSFRNLKIAIFEN